MYTEKIYLLQYAVMSQYIFFKNILLFIYIIDIFSIAMPSDVTFAHTHQYFSHV